MNRSAPRFAGGVAVTLALALGACSDDDADLDNNVDPSTQNDSSVNPPQGDAQTPPTANIDGGAPPANNMDAGGGGGDSCEALPEAFSIDGCDLPALCTVKQNGCQWEAKCGTETVAGSGDGSSFTFTHPDGRACTGTLQEGVLKGSCPGGDGGSCEFETEADPLPSPFCVELPSKLMMLNACTQPPEGAQTISATECDVIQDGCDFQASCDGGATVISGSATGTGLRWDTDYNFRCTGTLENGAVTGSCVRRGRQAADAGPAPSCDLSIQAPADPGALDCPQELPTQGFVLSGCALDGSVCHLTQRGCVWQANCGKEIFSGRVTEPGVYKFTTSLGASCTARVDNGGLVGSCSWGANESCEFGPGQIEPPNGCVTLPAQGFTSTGCAGGMTCDVVQSGCNWGARCELNGNPIMYYGEAVANGVKFPSGDYQCWAYTEEGTERLVGGCSTNGTEVSECSARVNEGKMILVPR